MPDDGRYVGNLDLPFKHLVSFTNITVYGKKNDPLQVKKLT